VLDQGITPSSWFDEDFVAEGGMTAR
jgi:hypothetical protein